MRKHIAGYAAACAGVLAAAVAFPTMDVVLAASCLAEPAGPAQNGYHWHYRLDHANHRKCWYLKSIAATAEKKASPRVRQSSGRSEDELTSSARGHLTKEREALFEEFLRWQKQQESRR